MVKYEPKVRVSRVIPFGYVLDKHDSKLLHPVEAELDALEQAMKYLKSKAHSYREVRRWLVDFTGRPISHKSLFYKYKQWLAEKYGRKQARPTP